MATQDEPRSIPEDFPPAVQTSAVPGASPKLNLVMVDGKYYPPGATPAQVRSQYEMCEDLANQLTGYCQKKIGQGMKQDDILVQVHIGLGQKGWAPANQNLWIIRRTASILGWKLPQSLAAEQ